MYRYIYARKKAGPGKKPVLKKIHAFFLASRNAKKGVLTTHLQLETVRVSTISVKS
jgi:hypothetical protein